MNAVVCGAVVAVVSCFQHAYAFKIFAFNSEALNCTPSSYHTAFLVSYAFKIEDFKSILLAPS